jgi:hypothetical protein
MRVVVPFTVLAPETDAALTRHAPDAERVDVSEDDYAYWRLLSDLWAAGEPFTVIEHDIVIHRGVLPAFDACPAPLCAFRYSMPIFGPIVGLGCTKFGAEVIEAVPDLWAEPISWRWLHGRFGRRLRDWSACVHEPPVDHHRRPITQRRPAEVPA